ncbi:DNA packaging protein UL32 [Cercopithecine betaherpesvirus 5]|uniref:Packaging protein UL32 n=1 Tax=Simian cytomegalovirus (strain Colburn) TaxID=50292 RepID=G8XTV8_SCMVC|nr:DNA packaging protein UL32 [Cercopithecine betaherpesvirus 5]
MNHHLSSRSYIYTGWEVDLTPPLHEITNELLWHAHPRQVPETAAPDTSQCGSAAGGGGSSSAGGGGDRATQNFLFSQSQSTDQLTGQGGGQFCDLDMELANFEFSDTERLKKLCTPLDIDTRCNICAIISICLKQDSDQAWLLDYSLLCFKCNSAPRTALSLLVTMSELTHLLRQHFPDLHVDQLFRQHVLTVFDFHLHFFINRCFEKQLGDAVENENITLSHLAVVKAMVMGDETVPYTKHRRFSHHKQKIVVKIPEAPKQLLQMFTEHSTPSPERFTYLLFYMWSGTGVMASTPLSELVQSKQHLLNSVADADDPEVNKEVGPVYLSPVPVFQVKNQTSTVCLLCELMACSHYDNLVLRELYRRITSYCENNVKMVDRIQLALADMLRECAMPLSPQYEDMSRYARLPPPADYLSSPAIRPDPVFCLVLRQAGVTGIYKHFFCDPQCAGNIRITREEVLFGRIHLEHLAEVKVAICHDNYYISQLPRRAWLYISIFKAFQITKRSYKSKTQLSDFMREFTQLLEACEIRLVDPSFIVDKYV